MKDYGYKIEKNSESFHYNSSPTFITIGLDGQSYTFFSLEAAYQAFKCPERMHEFTKLKPDEAVKLGRSVDLRPDWEEVKDDIYEHLLFLKYQPSNMRQHLLDKKSWEHLSNPYMQKVYDAYVQKPKLEFSGNMNRFCKDYCKKMETQRSENMGDRTGTRIRPLSNSKVRHSAAVAAFMMKNAGRWGCVPEEAYAVGLLHDIGYLNGRGCHEQNGALLLADLGISNTYYKAIYYHGTDPYDIKEELPIDVKKMLLCLYEADMSIDKDGNEVGFRGRLDDIKLRYGEDHIAYTTALNEMMYVKQNEKEFLTKDYVVSKE